MIEEKLLAIEKDFSTKGFTQSIMEINGDGVYIEFADEIQKVFEGLDELVQYGINGHTFDGGPGYEATNYVVSWIENGKLKVLNFLTECY